MRVWLAERLPCLPQSGPYGDWLSWETSLCSQTLMGAVLGRDLPVYQSRPVARIFFGGVRSLERKGYFCQRFSVAVKSIYNQLRHDNSLLL